MENSITPRIFTSERPGPAAQADTRVYCSKSDLLLYFLQIHPESPLPELKAEHSKACLSSVAASNLTRTVQGGLTAGSVFLVGW